MAKLNPTTMKTQYDGQYDTFCRKNHDYGNSFEESLDQFGIIASLVRMQDKMLRLQSLTDESKTQQVGSESLLDTLEDLSNYAAMTACWLKGVQAEDDVINKSYHHVKDMPSFRSLDDKHAQLVINSIKNYITDFNKEKEASKLTDEAYDFLEEQVTRAVEYMVHIRAHGRTPENKDIGDYAYDIARYALEQYPDPYRIIQHMGQILAMRSLNPNDALLFCSRVTDYIRNMNTKEKGSNKAKAMDKARWNVIAIGSRGAGKGFAKTRSLMEELGVPKETIKEIFEDLEDEDDE